MAKPVILAVDDDPQVLRAVERDLRRRYAKEYRILREAGADLDLRWKNVGHPLTYQEIEEATAWLSGVVPMLKS